MTDEPEDQPKTISTVEGTMIDLGEDLLESTKVLVRPSVESKQSVAPDLELEELQRGEILMNERLFDDAKKVFRKILRNDPTNSAARQFLDEIQKHEVKDLLGAEAPRKRLGSSSSADEDSPAAALARLEKDLQISIEKSELKPVPDLFKDQLAFSKYREEVLNTAIALPPRERLDIGIAHLEMELYDVAQSIFESVVRYEEHKNVGMYLLGLSLINNGKAIEATIRLEPFARDLTLNENEKADLLYLMGLAFERLKDTRKAREFFRRVHTLNPKYRDVVDKLR